jgi:uncharacterized protein (TIGR03084 family)
LCPGWTVADVVLHLALSEEGVVATTSGGTSFGGARANVDATMDEIVEAQISSMRGSPPADILERWTTVRRQSVAALRNADPGATFGWATNPLKPRTLATTRLSEHWIHANDIAQPLGLAFPDTDRIWHIARLAHRTIPYAYSRDGLGEAPKVRAELTAPSGEAWTFGEADADCVIRGHASEFCRIAGRRLAPAHATTIDTTGDRAGEVLELVRTYA